MINTKYQDSSWQQRRAIEYCSSRLYMRPGQGKGFFLFGSSPFWHVFQSCLGNVYTLLPFQVPCLYSVIIDVGTITPGGACPIHKNSPPPGSLCIFEDLDMLLHQCWADRYLVEHLIVHPSFSDKNVDIRRLLHWPQSFILKGSWSVTPMIGCL
ncbi:hypothetical protein OCU04_000052 [Sclerotinia nivalis]|uniref:Uncharacterized protein n=1 Tax=Sclerotinia nivalis TaxID=352851 RepID=A0A9X0DPD1_9HELO|nr:hypothetical protein OCU04_000052 [Sclerotinia nivalis]